MAQDRNESDSYMFVNGAWPLEVVLRMRAAVWPQKPRRARISPPRAQPSLRAKSAAK